jgi:hypothetical protein
MTTSAPPLKRELEELERALDGPPADVGDPFIHTFKVKPWRLLARDRIRAGDVALCGYVAPHAVRGTPVGKITAPRCPLCEKRLRERR